jgi:membrane-bound lytic murein transglycosylase D
MKKYIVFICLALFWCVAAQAGTVSNVDQAISKLYNSIVSSNSNETSPNSNPDNTSTPANTTLASNDQDQDTDQMVKQELQGVVNEIQTATTQPKIARHPQPVKTPQSVMKSNGKTIWQVMRQHFRLQHEYHNRYVTYELHRFMRHPQTVYLMLNNARPYIYYVYQQARLRHMPAEFALLPMVESMYNPYAYSRVGAGGLWQMMPVTATGYGIDISWWYDSRRDVQTSTKAALDYLVRLHHYYHGSWALAASAYDAGAGMVNKAIRHNRHWGKSTKFWSLPLPYETRAYFPKLLALAMIVQNPKRYGFTLPNIAAKPYFKSVTIQTQMDLGEISHLSGASIATIRYLNPGLRRWATAPDKKFTLLLPIKNANTFKMHLAHAAGHTHISWQYHEVRHGQTLQKIAHNFHTSTKLLRLVNNLKSSRLQVGQGILVPLSLNQRYEVALNGNVAVPVLNNKFLPNIDNGHVELASNNLSPQVTNKAAPKAKPVTAQPTIKILPPVAHQPKSLKALLNKIYGKV